LKAKEVERIFNHYSEIYNKTVAELEASITQLLNVQLANQQSALLTEFKNEIQLVNQDIRFKFNMLNKRIITLKKDLDLLKNNLLS
jgi:hypothetical protein